MLKRIIRKPFRGQYAYEIQIGPLVIQWRHDGKAWAKTHGISHGITINKLSLWKDSLWRR
jgi:hypothetical protein